MVKVSIVIPVYNASKYLKECLETLKLQTLNDLEFICVNDGSTDDSLAILQEYAYSDARFIIINKQNTGMGAAYNSGLEIAQGEYVGFVEPDDYVLPSMFEHLYDCTALKPDIVKSDWFLLSGNISKIQEKYTNFKEKLYNSNEIRNLMDGYCGHWSAIYKNEGFLKKYSIKFNETAGAAFQDVGFILKTHLLAKNIFIKPEPYYFYRLHSAQSVNSYKNNRFLQNFINEYNSVIEYFSKNLKALNEIDICLLNYYIYKLLVLPRKNLNYILRLSQILNLDIIKRGYTEDNFSEENNKIYLQIKSHPLLYFFKYIFNKMRILFNIYT